MRHFKQLLEAERHVIQKMTFKGISKYKIGEILDRHHSTIYKEIERNKTHGYKHKEAHLLAKKRRNKKQSKLDRNAILRFLVESLLYYKQSPEVIAYYLISNFPDDSAMHISHEAIYQWIYKQSNKNLTTCLFTRRKKRQTRSNIYKNRSVTAEKRNIKERPKDALEKTEHGHLEGNLIISAGQNSYVITINDRGVPVQSKDLEEFVGQ